VVDGHDADLDPGCRGRRHHHRAATVILAMGAGSWPHRSVSQGRGQGPAQRADLTFGVTPAFVEEAMAAKIVRGEYYHATVKDRPGEGYRLLAELAS
jgi:hypothetical protein